ncbi:hypothetical protein [Litorimonas haliclonae]|uniref:hypothetical protein n=1 Tax=Litorimonas haliclonae TaxID=2081977 RepID=UPI0039F0214E
MNITSLEGVLLKLLIGVAGIAGSVAHIIAKKPASHFESLQIVIVGFLCAVFVGPFLANIVPFVDAQNRDVLLGFGFLVGIFGIFITRITIKIGRGMSEGEGFKDAVINALLAYARKKGGQSDPN